MGNPFASRFVEALRGAALSYEQPELLAGLARHVREAFVAADMHRRSSGVERDLIRCLRAVNNQYDPEDYEVLNGIDIYIGLTNLKARGAKAWITDILANTEDQPWTIRATPKPDLPDEATEAVRQKLVEEIARYGLTFNLQDRASHLLAVAQKHTDAVAAASAERMEAIIRDRMVEAGWRNTFDQFVDDLVTYPTAILRGPSATLQTELRWVGSRLVPVRRMLYKMVRVDPFRLYPSPNSVCPNSGAYIIERVDLSADELAACMDLPFFDAAAIRSVFAKFPSGKSEHLSTQTAVDMANRTKADTHAPSDGVYQTLVYYGKVKGDLLLEHNVVGVDPQRVYESEVWTCGDIVLRAMLNPHPLGRRPFFSCSFEPVAGSFWGKSLPILLRDVQRLANAAARSLVRNMSYSAGPIGEVDYERLATSETNVEEVTPYRIYRVSADRFSSTPSPAFRFQIVPSVADQLLRIYEYYAKMADDISGIPAYVLGNPQVAGAGRTLGGLSLLMGNAAKGVKNVIASIDKHVIEPVVKAYWTLEMIYGTDASAKGDSQVVARGASGLLQRELSQARAVEVLNMLTPYAQAGLVPPAGLQVVIRDVLKSLGYSADDIVPDPARAAQLAAAGGQRPPMPSGMSAGAPVPSLQPGTPPPRLDGRSAPPPDPGAVRLPAADA
jgi:hypothetical protein